MLDTPDDLVEIFAACPACVSLTEHSDRDAAEDTVSNHNDSAHDGKNYALAINVHDPDELGEFLDRTKELASGEEFENLLNRMRNGNASFFCSAKLFQESGGKQHRRNLNSY